MKKIFYLLFASLFLVAGCDDNDDNSQGKRYKITIKGDDIINAPSNNDINEVRLVAGNGIPLATAKWDRGFEMEFPEAVAASNLENILDFLGADEGGEDGFLKDVTVSDITAMITVTSIRGYRDNIGSGYFYFGAENVRTEYVYVNKDLSVTGSAGSENYGLNLKKGWRRVTFISAESDGSREITSSVPGGLGWFYTESEEQSF